MSAPWQVKKLTPEEEVAYLKEIFGPDSFQQALRWLVGSFTVLQVRAQMLLGLITICLTITGFSGPQIAATNVASKICIAAGLFFVLLSALLLLCGPLQLRWGTQRRAPTNDESLMLLVYVRNRRARYYYIATGALIVGLSFYVASVLEFLVQV